MKTILATFLISTLLMAAQAQTTTLAGSELLAKVQQGDPRTILEAGSSSDKSLIPVLEGMARPHFVARISPEAVKDTNPQRVEAMKEALWLPVYDDPTAVSARMALAKLGVKKYLDEILLELTDPKNSPVYKERDGHPGFPHSKYDAIRIRGRAFGKIPYIADRSTIKVVASFLYGEENPEDYVEGNEPGSIDLVFFETPSQMAMKTLAQIVDNPPKIDIPDNAYTYDARLHAWQQWWEQNKDKYP